MTVSVIMPAYNAEKTISKAIESVLTQSYMDFELIIVNDGSTDGTEDIILSWSKRDSRIKNLSIRNSGVSNARNIALSNSSGDFVTFIDSDDEMESDFIERMICKMTDDCDLVCCGYTVVSNTGKKILDLAVNDGKYELSNYYQGIELLQDKKLFNLLWNKLFRLSIIRENGITLDTNVSMGEDYFFVVDYLTKMRGALFCLSSKLYRYTISPYGAQATLNKGDTIEKRIKRINYLVPLYVREGYPMNSIYDEQLRYIYSSLRDSKLKKEDISILLQNEEIKNLRYYNPQKIKMKLFLKVLFINNVNILMIFIGAFSFVKRVLGKSFKWN